MHTEETLNEETLNNLATIILGEIKEKLQCDTVGFEVTVARYGHPSFTQVNYLSVDELVKRFKSDPSELQVTTPVGEKWNLTFTRKDSLLEVLWVSDGSVNGLVTNYTGNLTSDNIPSNRYPKERKMIKQEQGLPFDLEQLCNNVSNACGSVHSLKETIRTITQNQELVDQLERQKKRYLLEVTSDIVSNWNSAVEFRFSPYLPVESLFLHFPERSVDLNRHVVTFLNNCKLKYIYKTDVKEEHYLLSVELADKTYNVGIPVNAVDYITILSAFGGRVDLKTLIAKFQ